MLLPGAPAPGYPGLYLLPPLLTFRLLSLSFFLLVVMLTAMPILVTTCLFLEEALPVFLWKMLSFSEAALTFSMAGTQRLGEGKEELELRVWTTLCPTLFSQEMLYGLPSFFAIT